MKSTGFVMLFTFAACTVPAAGQKIPRGVHSYAVHGEGEYGSQMAPWESVIEVSDTTVGGSLATRVHFGSRSDGNGGWRFNEWATFSQLPPQAYQVVHAGRGMNGATECKADVSEKRIKAGTETKGPFDAIIVPEMALPLVLSGLSLQPGSKTDMVVFRCDGGGLVTFNTNASVTAGKARRTDGGEPEDVWMITGSGDYAFKAAIAKSDGTVLHYEIPQGPSDMMIFDYRGTKPSR